jgi:hypothetical protein
VPMDIMAEILEADVVPASPLVRPTIPETTAAKIAAELRGAARPLLLAGGGTRRAAAEVRRLSELAGLPVVHTLMGTGILPPDHPQLLGMIGFWGSPTATSFWPSARGFPRRTAAAGSLGSPSASHRHASSTWTLTRTSQAATTRRPSRPPLMRPSR